MKSTLYSLNSDKGFTLPELLVGSFIGLIIVGMALSGTMASKRLFGFDMKRIQLDQNLRSAMDVIGGNLRVGGENLSRIFPAFEIVNGAGTAPDELIVRRNLLDEVLSVCSSVSAGTNQSVYFARTGSTASGCTISGQTFNYNSWQAHRVSKGGSVKAFVYDVTSKRGEFFDYTAEGSNGSGYFVVRGSGNWLNAYPATSSSIYILEEWRLRLQDTVLQLSIDGDTAAPNNVVAGLTNFQVQAHKRDGTIMDTLGRTDDWSELTAIQVAVTASATVERQPISRTLTSRFFPRNILSQ
jgi:type IV pilus assembly protein PilW